MLLDRQRPILYYPEKGPCGINQTKHRALLAGQKPVRYNRDKPCLLLARQRPMQY